MHIVTEPGVDDMTNLISLIFFMVILSLLKNKNKYNKSKIKKKDKQRFFSF